MYKNANNFQTKVKLVTYWRVDPKLLDSWLVSSFSCSKRLRQIHTIHTIHTDGNRLNGEDPANASK